MKTIEIAVAIVTCLLLAGCGGSEGEAKKAVLEFLKDPDSAKFGEFTEVGGRYACLTVNAKNSMGGYTGNQQAILFKNEDGGWTCRTTIKESHENCIAGFKPKVDADEATREAKATPEAKRRSHLVVGDVGSGVLRQPVSGLEWTQSDNGGIIKWTEANSWCADRGGNWRLPSVAELQSLYDASGEVITSCGSSLIVCKVSPLLHLTGFVLWSNEKSDIAGDWSVVELYSGDRGSSEMYANDARALCVRVPK